MRKLLFLLAVLCCTYTYAQEPKALAGCCTAATTTVKTFGRCSGDASCTACTNCKYCKHCSKEGGSCGVCASEPVKQKPAKKKRATKKKRRQ